MTNRSRRSVLSGTVSATLLVAGCVGGSPGVRDGTTVGASETATPTDAETGSGPVLTGYETSDATVRPSAERPDDQEAWGLYLATREAADAQFDDPKEADDDDAEAVRAFVAATEFDAGDRLLYVESYGPQTCYELVLEGEPRVEDGRTRVDAGVERTEPADRACDDAVTPVALLVRLSFGAAAGPPDVVEVRVQDGWDENVTLRLEAVR